MLLLLIVICEVAFWALLAGGLAARYLLRRRSLSTALLLAVPLADLVLLAASVADLAGGATAGATHGLAAMYLGFSVAFGHDVIRWADERFAHRFAGGPPPRRAPRGGTAKARHEWRAFGKAVLACAIAAALLLAAIAVVGDAERTEALRWSLARLGLVLGVWAVWPVSATLTARRAPVPS